MADRFGLLPLQVKTQLRIAKLKPRAASLGMRKIEASPKGERLMSNE